MLHTYPVCSDGLPAQSAFQRSVKRIFAHRAIRQRRRCILECFRWPLHKLRKMKQKRCFDLVLAGCLVLPEHFTLKRKTRENQRRGGQSRQKTQQPSPPAAGTPSRRGASQGCESQGVLQLAEQNCQTNLA